MRQSGNRAVVQLAGIAAQDKFIDAAARLRLSRLYIKKFDLICGLVLAYIYLSQYHCTG
jgi:hypothetical protein